MVRQKGIAKTYSKRPRRKVAPESVQPAGLINSERRKALLTELANLHEQGCERFWREWGWLYPRESDADLLKLRDELRKVWEPISTEGEEPMTGLLWNPRTNRCEHTASSIFNESHKIGEKQAILDSWLAWRPADVDPKTYRPWRAMFGVANPLPDPRNLRAALALVVLYERRWMLKCGNADCPTPYFLGRRIDQKFCERGDCTSYAQRQYALKWWRREGEKRRAKRKKVRRKSTQKRREGK